MALLAAEKWWMILVCPQERAAKFKKILARPTKEPPASSCLEESLLADWLHVDSEGEAAADNQWF